MEIQTRLPLLGEGGMDCRLTKVDAEGAFSVVVTKIERYL